MISHVINAGENIISIEPKGIININIHLQHEMLPRQKLIHFYMVGKQALIFNPFAVMSVLKKNKDKHIKLLSSFHIGPLRCFALVGNTDKNFVENIHEVLLYMMFAFFASWIRYHA